MRQQPLHQVILRIRSASGPYAYIKKRRRIIFDPAAPLSVRLFSFLWLTFFSLHIGSFICLVHESALPAKSQPPLQVVVWNNAPKGFRYCSPYKAGIASFTTGCRYKRLGVSSFLDSSDCSAIYFLIADSVTLPIVAT